MAREISWWPSAVALYLPCRHLLAAEPVSGELGVRGWWRGLAGLSPPIRFTDCRGGAITPVLSKDGWPSALYGGASGRIELVWYFGQRL
jgi:hypothetical protein